MLHAFKKFQIQNIFSKKKKKNQLDQWLIFPLKKKPIDYAAENKKNLIIKKFNFIARYKRAEPLFSCRRKPAVYIHVKEFTFSLQLI